MVIDFHTHTFPDALAPRAVGELAESADMMNYSDGTVSGLRASMERAGVDVSLAAPVVTKPHQTEGINRAAQGINDSFTGRGVLSLGGIHPDTECPERVLEDLKARGFRGIKLHPLFQGTDIDDRRNLRIIEKCAELDMIVLIHAGLDPTFPGTEHASPKQILHMLRQVPYGKIVLAHLGAMGQWFEAEEIYGQNVYLDTACTLYPWRNRRGGITDFEGYIALTNEQFTGLVRRHGADRVLFGSDSPWTDQLESRTLLDSSGLTDAELRAVLGGNAAKLLGLEEWT